MNDIKILEDLLKQKYDKQLLENISMINEKDEVFVLTTLERQAIENLIQENKELKEHLQKYYNGELYTAKQLKNIEENQRKYFIHKSKIKEIIYPTPENPISFEVQSSEMYKKLEKLVEGE